METEKKTIWKEKKKEYKQVLKAVSQHAVTKYVTSCDIRERLRYIHENLYV